MDDCRSESDFTKSRFSTKKTMLNKVKKKKRIRVPISFNKSRSFNASLNSTFSKVSLSANNRALARALQVKKEQLYNAVQVIQQMQINEQKYLQELASSKELITKMKKTVEDMEKAQGKVFVSLNNFIEDLTKTVDIYSTLQKSFSDFLGNTSPKISATESPAFPQLASADFINKRRPKRWLNKPARVLATPENGTKQKIDSNSPEISASQSSGDKDGTLPECSQPSVTPEDVVVSADQSKQTEDDLQPLGSYPDVPYPCSSAPDLSMITEQSFLQDIPNTAAFSHLRGERHQTTHRSAEGETTTETPIQQNRTRSRSSLNRRQTRVISRNSTDSVKLAENTKRLEDVLGDCHDVVADVPKEVDTDKNTNQNCQSIAAITRTSNERTAQNTRSRSRSSVNRRMTGVISRNKTDLLKLSDEKNLLDDKVKCHSDAVKLAAENAGKENRLTGDVVSACTNAERNRATHELPDVAAGDRLPVKEAETARETNTRCTRSRSRSCVDRRRTRVLCTNNTENPKLGEDRKQLDGKSRNVCDVIGDAAKNVDADSGQTTDNKTNSADGLQAKKAETRIESSAQQKRSRSRSCASRRQTRVLHRRSTELIRKDEGSRDLDVGILEQCIPVFDTSGDTVIDAQNTTASDSSHAELPDTEDGVICDDFDPASLLNLKSSGNDDLRNAGDVREVDVHAGGQMHKGVEQKLGAGFQSSEVTICDVQDMELTEVISSKDLEKIALPSFIKENNREEPSFLKSVEEQNCFRVEGIPDTEMDLCKSLKDNRAGLKKSRLPQPQVVRKSRKQLKSDDLGNKNDVQEKKKATEVPEKLSENVTADRNSKKKEETRTEQSNSQKMSVSDTDSSCQSDSEGEAVMKRYMAYLVKPGKISFTAGRKNCTDLIGSNPTRKSRSKSRSILPTMQKSRSKSRSKSALPNNQAAAKRSDAKGSDAKGSDAKGSDAKGSDCVFEFISPRSRRRNSGSPKHPADISLSESTCQPKPSYSQFCGREMPHPKRTVPVVCDSEEEVITDSPHGIMLVLANGRRTKPRSKGKSVRYKREIHRIISPENSPLEASDVDNTQKEQSVEGVGVACLQPMAVDAGNTPVRRPVRKKSIREEGFCVPESPVVGEGAAGVGVGALTADVNLKQFSLDVPDLVTDNQHFNYDSPVVRRKAARQRQQQLISSSSEEDEEECERQPATKKKQFSTKMKKAKVTKSRCSLQQSRQRFDAKKPHQEEDVVHETKQKNMTTSAMAPPEAGQVRGHRDQTENALDAEPNGINGVVPKTEPEPEVGEAKSDAVTPPTKQSLDHQKSHNDRDVETEKENISGSVKESSCQQEEAAPRKRRAAAAVKSYKEPVINKKLRRGDDHTSTIYGEQELERFKSEINKKMKKKRSTIGKSKQECKDGFEHSEEERKRRALATISNTCSSSDSS